MTIKKAAQGIVYLLALLPAASMAFTIFSSRTNVPFWDEWGSFVPIALATVRNELTVAQIFAFHNEHRIVFSKLTTVLLAMTTDWTLWAQTVVSFLLAGISLWLLVKLAQPEVPGWITIVPYALLVFDDVQTENFIVAFQSAWFFSTAFFLATLWVLKTQTPTLRTIAVAALLATCGTFSLGNGLFIWGAAILALWMLGYRSVSHYALWIVLAATSITVFLWEHPSIAQSTSAELPTIRFIIEYTLTYSAQNLTAPPFNTRAALLGAIGLLIFAANAIYLYWQERRIAPFAVWVAMISFVLISGVTSAVLRNDSGLANASVSRYSTGNYLFWAAITGLLTQGGYLAAKKRQWFVLGLNTGIFCFMVYAIVNHSPILFSKIERREANIDCVYLHAVSAVEVQEPCLLDLHPHPRHLPERIKALAEEQLGPFRSGQFEVPLTDVPFYIFEMNHEVGYQAANTLFQHAPGRIEHKLTLPAIDGAILLTGATIVDPQAARDFPDVPQNGVHFQLHLLTDDDQSTLVHESVFNPELDTDPQPFSVDLSAYKGQTIRLHFETDARGDATYDWAMWVNPTLHLGTMLET